MAVQQEIKSQLAKLLATEDIVVEHKQVECAQFNVRTRVLILPLWEKATDDVYYPKAKDEHNKLEKTPKLIHNLKQLYRKDIEAFYPELAA